MSGTPAPKARLYAILARKAPTAVIFRRGPSQWVQIIRWNTDTDTFEPGQWFHGRIYEHRCDLSPDGKLIVYMAASKSSPTDQAYGWIWTAVSKLPYLTALALWPQIGTFEGGGHFLSPTDLVVNFHSSKPPHPDHLPTGIHVVYSDEFDDAPEAGKKSTNLSESWETIQHHITQPVPVQSHQYQKQSELARTIIGLEWANECVGRVRTQNGPFTLQPGVYRKDRHATLLERWEAEVGVNP